MFESVIWKRMSEIWDISPLKLEAPNHTFLTFLMTSQFNGKLTAIIFLVKRYRQSESLQTELK